MKLAPPGSDPAGSALKSRPGRCSKVMEGERGVGTMDAMAHARAWMIMSMFGFALVGGLAAQAQTEPPVEPAVQPVIDEAQVHDIVVQLQGQLDRLGGVAKITRCGPVLGLLTPQTGGFDRSYGASCDIQVADRRLQALMCDDSRGREFAMSLATVPDVEAMRRFIVGNCFPSG